MNKTKRVVVIRKKKRRVVRREKSESRELKEGEFIQDERCTEFQNRVRALSGNPVALMQFIRDEYERVVGSEAPEPTPFLLIKRRVAYELLARPYAEKGVALPPKLKEQLTKSRKMSYDVWDADESFLGRLYAQAIGAEGNGMSKKKAASGKAPAEKKRSGSTSGLSVQAWYCKKMEDQGKKKLTDKELADLYKKEFPKTAKRDPEYFRVVRNAYNVGKIKPQAGKAPKVPVPEFTQVNGKRLAVPFKGRGHADKNAALKKAGIKAVPVPEKAKPAPKKPAKKKTVKKKVVKKVVRKKK